MPFQPAEPFFVLPDVAGDGFECGAQVADLGDQPGQGAAPAWRTRCSPMMARICGLR